MKTKSIFVFIIFICMLGACKIYPTTPGELEKTTETNNPTAIISSTVPVPTLDNTITPWKEPILPPLVGTPQHKSGLECVSLEAGAGAPPSAINKLNIQISLPTSAPDEVITFFKSFARPCDGLGVMGRASPPGWENLHTNLAQGIIFYSLPSLEMARSTAGEWTSNSDWFAYEFSLMDNTPENEQNDPADSSRLAMEFAHSHKLAYMPTPGGNVTRRYAADIAQYADAYGMQAYGVSRDAPDTFIQFVQETSKVIRAVNPDILLFIAFSTNLSTDDPQTTFALIERLIGQIDGVFLRTNNQTRSIQNLKTLVGLLRGQ